jgi:epoxide hydrolase 4
MAEDSNLTRRVAGDGVELAVTVAGDGPPVVFLHGFPENARSWRHQIEAVTRAGFSAWAPDLRGYGESDRPTSRDAYHLRHLMADVAAIVRSTGSPRAHIVGHDWGGIIAWSFAGHHAALVDKLVILNAPHLKPYVDKVWRSPQLFRSWYVALFLLPRVPEWLLSAQDFAAIRRMFRSASGQRTSPFSADAIDAYVAQFRSRGALTAALDYYRANARTDGTRVGVAARIAAETLVIWGDKDPALDVSLLDGLADVAPAVRIHRLRDVGHWVQNEAPEQVNRLLVEFLTSRDRAER